MARSALVALGIACAVALAGGCGGEEPLRLGVVVDCQGPFRGLEDGELSGAELPLLRRGAKLLGSAPSAGVSDAEVAGRPVRLVRGCAEAGEHSVFIQEARRLVEEEHVDAVVGGASVVARDVARLYPEVPFLATTWAAQEVTLRDPAPNLYRVTIDHAQQAAGLGEYAYRELGWRRASVLAAGSTAGWTGAAAFVAEFCALGGRIVRQVYRDPFAPRPDVAQRALEPDPDGVAVFLTPFDDATGVLGDLVQRLDDLPRRLLLWSEQVDDPQLLQALGRRLDGVALTGWFAAEQPSAALVRYRARYRAAFPGLPPAFADGWWVLTYHDSVEALLTAFERADGDLSDGRRRLREELARLRVELPRGDVRLDRNRQAVADVPLVRLRAEGGDLRFEPVGIAEDVEQTFGGLLADAPPPGPASQPCVRAEPPAWAR